MMPIALAVLALLQSPAPPIWLGLEPGNPVGYRRLTSPAIVHVWYPAASGSPDLTFAGYLGADTAATRSFLEGVKIAPATVTSWLASPFYATRNAPPLPGRFPLVLVAQGNGNDAADQAVLCEYLASHGFVVATVASPMKRQPMTAESQVGAFAERQATELLGVVAEVAAALPADTARIAALGHSFGARAALLMVMREPTIKALVSLDGGIGTATAIEPLKTAPSYRADRPLPPILHLYEELDPFMKPDFTLLRSLEASQLLLEPVQDLHHVHFTTYGFAAARVPGIGTATHATDGTGVSVAATARRVLGFLQANLPQR